VIEEAMRALTFAAYFVGTVAFVILAGLAIAGLARLGTEAKDRWDTHHRHKMSRVNWED